ncbi:MAG TPA: FtsX-like permease family protein [Clostridia bacterium]|nr:FtsX-like permease family protein [Clostridia bacterium]
MNGLRTSLIKLGFGFEMALGGIAQNRLRSLLTIIGVTIGVASVVSLVSIGEGARQVIVSQFESLGTNVIEVKSHHPRMRLKVEDAYELEERVPSIAAAMPVIETQAQVKWRRNVRKNVGILGVSEEFPFIRDHKLLAGRFFGLLHVKGRVRVAVVGYDLVDSLFDGRNPIGQGIYIDGQRYRVLGVLEPKGSKMAGGIDQKIVVPVTTAQRITKSYAVDAIWAKAKDRNSVDLAVVHISRVMRKKFGLKLTSATAALKEGGSVEGTGGSGSEGEGGQEDQAGEPGGEADTGEGKVEGARVTSGAVAEKTAIARVVGGEVVPYGPGEQGPTPPSEKEGPLLTITSLNEMVKEASKANRVMTLMLAGIASVSLLVGGLGIMNIMLVSVSERTAEIGLRKALGATRADLLYQFLVEAFLLSGFGGVLGVILGYAGARFLQLHGIETVITWGSSWVALGVAMIVGLAFGVYPAYVASGLSPVEALRH